MKLLFKNADSINDHLAPTKIVVSVPYRMPGNVIKHKEVTFEIFQRFNRIRAIALVDKATRDILNLPQEIIFTVVDGVAINVRPALKDVARNIAEALFSKHSFSLS